MPNLLHPPFAAARMPDRHPGRRDPLTGLWDGAALTAHLADMLAGTGTGAAPRFAIIMIDIYRLKHVNEVLGRAAGDDILNHLAERIGAICGPDEGLFRVAGDEFVILAPISQRREASALAARVIELFLAPVRTEPFELVVTPSIGIACAPEDGEEPDLLLKRADLAMSRATHDGGNCWRWFEPGMEERLARRLHLTTALRHAIDRREFFLVYQPQVAVSNGRICGVEALLRWRHPELGLLSPAEFIPVAEESGQIVGIGTWVLEEALHQLRLWIAAGLPPIRMSVNLSTVQFRQRGLVGEVMRIVHESGVPAHLLELEITEGTVMGEPEAAIATIENLRQLGVGFALDDFGTGYSSLAYLKRLPLDRLKIDRSFLSDVTENEDSAVIVRAILGLAQALHYPVIAEGVETGEQLRFLRALGCEEAQGYLFAKPLPPGEIAAMLQTRGAIARRDG